MLADNWSLLTLDEDSRHLRFAITVRLEDYTLVKNLILDSDRGVVGRAISELKPQSVPDVSASEHFDPSVDWLTGFTIRAILSAPP